MKTLSQNKNNKTTSEGWEDDSIREELALA